MSVALRALVAATLLVANAAHAAPALDPRGGVVVDEGEMTLSDGTKLAHSLMHPSGDGPWPILLVRTCYARRTSVELAQLYVDRGFAAFVQDVRGTGKSEGEWRPFLHEPKDGAETFDWVVQQPWCNGKVASVGSSYLGVTQWAYAPHAKERLSAMSVHFASADVPRDVVHFGGVQGLAIGLAWALATSGGGMPRFRALPLIEADDASGRDLAVWNDWCRHPRLDDYWKDLDYAPRYADVKAPALLVAGWYDLFLPGQLDDFMKLQHREGPVEQTFARLIVGPWDHDGTTESKGRPDLGPEAYGRVLDDELSFLERFVAGEPNGYEQKDGVRAFFLGENVWRELPTWPPPDARETSFFLRSLGGAAKKPGDGMLIEARAPARDEPADEFVYDPRSPCPSYAESLWRPLSTESDQAQIAAREDVLVYATPPLAQEVRVAGPITLEVWIESDAPDTDVAAKLVDVAPDGSMAWRGEGIQRARTRNGPTEDDLLEPGVPARLQVRMGHVAATFAAGHRIGLHVTSSNFPRFSRNLNTLEPSNLAKQPRVARNRVLHRPDQPSRLVLWTLGAGG